MKIQFNIFVTCILDELTVSKSRGAKKRPSLSPEPKHCLDSGERLGLSFFIKQFLDHSNRLSMEQLLSCPITFENPTSQNLPCIPT